MLINKKISAAFIATLASLSASGWILWQIPLKQDEANNWVKHTHEVLTELETTLSTLKDAETGQRGYLLTGDEHYLEPYNQAKSQINGQLQKLKTLTADNLKQQQQITKLYKQTQAKLSELKQTIELRQKRGLSAATGVVLSARGMQQMDAIRQIIAEMKQEEIRLLDSRTYVEQESVKATKAAFSMLFFLDVGLIGFIYYLIVYDTSKRNQIELALRDRKQLFQQLVENIREIFWINTPEANYLSYISPVYEEIWGRSCASLYEQPQSFLNTIHPEDREQVVAAIPSQREGKYKVEYRIVRPDGEQRWISDRAFPVENENGEIYRIVGIAEDITERKHLEATLRQQAEELATANRMKDEFLAVVSHELRTPLNSMLGWSSMLRSGKLKPETIPRALEAIHRNAKMQAQLIEDLLDVSRMIRGKLRLDITNVNLIMLVSEAVSSTLQSMAFAKQIQIIETSNNLSSVIVAGDFHRLQQIILNLLSNAIKFTPNGGRVEVELSVVEGSRENANSPNARIRVSDTGCGIDAEFLPHVFERFQQADASSTRMQSGLGLGLAIVGHLVELHGGTVQAQSLGKGTGATFIVNLPLSSCEILETSNSSAPSASCLNNLHLLVVDDQADTRELIATVLQEYGATVTTAASSAEALEALSNSHFDVLISDIGMPNENGYSFIRKVRVLPQVGKIPAVALTAYASEEDRTAALSAGFEMHLSKPVNPVDLVGVVASLVN
jgi:PAS domain S-box-containing protein